MNIDKLKKVIQEANPEIMELKFGCEVVVKDEPVNFRILGRAKQELTYKAVAGFNTTPETIHIDDIEKRIGRPIRLADVLWTIQQNRNDANKHGYSIRHTGRFYQDNLDSKANKFMADWNLKDDNLDHQSDETKQFLIDLLIG